jgi:hypothetical protein
MSATAIGAISAGAEASAGFSCDQAGGGNALVMPATNSK